MNLPQPMKKAIEAMMKAADTRSCLGMAEGCKYAHDSIYRALEVELERYFMGCLTLLKLLGGLNKGYLILDDVVIARWQRGLLNLPKIKDSSSNQYVRGFSVVVLLWTNGLIRLPLAFRVCWGDEGKERNKHVLAKELLLWAVEQGFKPEYVLFDAWYASKELLRKIHELGWSFVTRLRKNRLLDGRPGYGFAGIAQATRLSSNNMDRSSGSKKASSRVWASWSRYSAGVTSISAPTRSDSPRISC